jgi:hypothetical protein
MEDTKGMNKHNKSVESEKHIIEPLHQNNDSCEMSKRFEKLKPISEYKAHKCIVFRSYITMRKP